MWVKGTTPQRGNKPKNTLQRRGEGAVEAADVRKNRGVAVTHDNRHWEESVLDVDGESKRKGLCLIVWGKKNHPAW